MKRQPTRLSDPDGDFSNFERQIEESLRSGSRAVKRGGLFVLGVWAIGVAVSLGVSVAVIYALISWANSL